MVYLCFVLLWLLPLAASADILRVATFHTELSQRGPGLLYHKLLSKDDQSLQIARLIAEANADIIVLQGVDYDHDRYALAALRDLIADHGVTYPQLFARPPNRGVPLQVDVNGDGQISTPEDTQSYGHFAGQSGMAVLSKHPLQQERLRDFSALLWRDVLSPDAPRDRFYPDDRIWDQMPLSATAHWVLSFDVGGHSLTLLTSHNTAPVFDGPEDRNGWRNHDETRLWLRYLDGDFGPVPETLIYAGVLNADPVRGDARKASLTALLTHPGLQDPLGAAPTVDWAQTGPMRVSYILPSVRLRVAGHGRLWTHPSSRHALLWVDLELPRRR